MPNSMKNRTIDATNRVLGRIASEAAYILMGKNEPDYQPNVAGKTVVTITNASKIKVTEKKLSQTMYERYSGYPGGLKFLSLKEVITRKDFSGRQIFGSGWPAQDLHCSGAFVCQQNNDHQR